MSKNFSAAQVGGEARLGEADVAELEREPGGQHRVAAVGDVGERPAVHQRGRALHRLHQVRVDGVAQQRGHRAGHPERVGGHRLAVGGQRDQHPAEPLLEVHQVLGQAQRGHDLGGRGDEEARLARHAVEAPAEPDHHVAQGAIVDVEDALPRHLADVDAERVAVVEVVVDGGGEQVVRRGDRVEVAGEVQVDLVHRHHLRPAAPGAAALHAERGPDGGLAQRDDRPRTDAPERLPDADGHGGLAVAGRGRRDGRHHHELAVGPVAAGGQRADAHLGLVVAVRDPLLRAEAELARDLGDRPGLPVSVGA